MLAAGLLTQRPTQVLESGDQNIGFNAATGKYEDLMKAGIIDPTKVGFLACTQSYSRQGLACLNAAPVCSLRSTLQPS